MYSMVLAVCKGDTNPLFVARGGGSCFLGTAVLNY